MRTLTLKGNPWDWIRSTITVSKQPRAKTTELHVSHTDTDADREVQSCKAWLSPQQVRDLRRWLEQREAEMVRHHYLEEER